MGVAVRSVVMAAVAAMTVAGCAERASLSIEVAASNALKGALKTLDAVVLDEDGVVREVRLQRSSDNEGRWLLFEALDLVKGRTYRLRLSTVSLDAAASGCANGEAVGLSPPFVYRQGMRALGIHLGCADQSQPAGTLAETRLLHTATWIPNPAPHGLVVIVGGANDDFDPRVPAKVNLRETIEVFDPDGATFTMLDEPTLRPGRAWHTAVRTGPDEIVIAGGFAEREASPAPEFAALTLVHRLEAAGQGVAPSLVDLADLAVGRGGHGAVLLDDNQLLLAKGLTPKQAGSAALELSKDAEVYDVRKGASQKVFSRPDALVQVPPTLAALPDGKSALLLGGLWIPLVRVPNELACIDGDNCDCETKPCIQPTLGFPRGQGRSFLTATVVPCSGTGDDGAIFLVGGSYGNKCVDQVFGDIWCIPADNPTVEPTRVGSLLVPRTQHTTTLVRGPGGGRLLVAGGLTNNSTVLTPVPTIELVPVSCRCRSVGKIETTPLRYARFMHTATLLPDGTVLLAGGKTGFAERFTPAF